MRLTSGAHGREGLPLLHANIHAGPEAHSLPHRYPPEQLLVTQLPRRRLPGPTEPIERGAGLDPARREVDPTVDRDRVSPDLARAQLTVNSRDGALGRGTPDDDHRRRLELFVIVGLHDSPPRDSHTMTVV